MSNLLFGCCGPPEHAQKEIVTVTAKQYLAVAENLLNALFLDLSLGASSDYDETNNFALYIRDEDDTYIARRTHSC